MLELHTHSSVPLCAHTHTIIIDKILKMHICIYAYAYQILLIINNKDIYFKTILLYTYNFNHSLAMKGNLHANKKDVLVYFSGKNSVLAEYLAL